MTRTKRPSSRFFPFNCKKIKLEKEEARIFLICEHYPNLANNSDIYHFLVWEFQTAILFLNCKLNLPPSFLHLIQIRVSHEKIAFFSSYFFSRLRKKNLNPNAGSYNKPKNCVCVASISLSSVLSPTLHRFLMIFCLHTHGMWQGMAFEGVTS